MEVDHADEHRPLPAELMQHAGATWVAATRNVRISQLHSEVSQLLTIMGIAHEVEYLTDGDLFSLDLAIPGESNNALTALAGGLSEEQVGNSTNNTIISFQASGELCAAQQCFDDAFLR